MLYRIVFVLSLTVLQCIPQNSAYTGDPIARRDKTKGKETTVPLADLAIRMANESLNNASEIYADFTCWCETESIVLVQSEDSPREESIVTIVSRNHENEWEAFVRKFHLVSKAGSRAIWDQRLEQNLKGDEKSVHRRVGYLNARGKARVFKSSDVEGIPDFKFRVFNPVLDAFSSGHMRKNKISIKRVLTHALLDESNIVDVRNEPETRDLIATWEYAKTAQSHMKVTLRFSRKSGNMPVESSYYHVWKEGEFLVSRSKVSWEKISKKFWVPTSVDRYYRTLSAKTEIQRRSRYDWKIGDGNPDSPPKSETGDIRLVYCKLFKKDCVDPIAEHVRVSDVMEVLRDFSDE